jgi:hypothetical protein
MFWGKYGASSMVLSGRRVRQGISAAIVAEICSQVREAGGDFLYGGGRDQSNHSTNASRSAGRQFVPRVRRSVPGARGSAGKSARDIVRGCRSRK